MKISIILPVYNKEKYIEHTLTDIKNQTFKDYECILVDDGSVDESGAICDKIATLDNRFKVIHTMNQGVSEARNTGIMHATGELLTFIDGDDRVDSIYLEHLYDCYMSSDVDIVISNLAKIWGDGRKENGVSFPYSGKKTIDDILPQFVSCQKNTGLYGFCVGKLFKRELASGILFDKTIKWAEDFDYYLRLYERVNTICFDNNCHYYYLQEADNSSFNTDDYKVDYLTQLMINLRVKTFLEKKGSYTNENKSIQDRTIGRYIYYCLFYVELANFNDRYYKLKNLISEYNLAPINTADMRQKIVMRFFWKNHPNLIKYFLIIFRCLRNILRS